MNLKEQIKERVQKEYAEALGYNSYQELSDKNKALTFLFEKKWGKKYKIALNTEYYPLLNKFIEENYVKGNDSSDGWEWSDYYVKKENKDPRESEKLTIGDIEDIFLNIEEYNEEIKDVDISLIYLNTEFNKNNFTIFGCGKFGESKKVLNKSEASLLYIELHKFLTQEN